MSGSQIVIVDGALNYTAKVDDQRRLKTFSTVRTSSTEAAINENQFSVSAPIFEITGDTEIALMYVENTDTTLWEATVVEVLASQSNSTESWRVGFHANDKDSTIRTAGTPFTPFNLNVGSAKLLASNTRAGGDGFPMLTTPSTQRLVPAGASLSIIPLDSAIIPPGASIIVSMVPPAGNTSMFVDVAFTIVRETQL